MVSTTRYPISALPLASPAQLLIHRLTPDTHTPSVAAFRSKVLAQTPSLQRRARLLSPPCHFSFVNPFPTPFPYDIDPPVNNEPVADKGAYIEQWLSAREAVHQRPLPADGLPRPLRLHDPKLRDQPRILIALSDTGLRDCVPHLDVGDAFAVLGAPSLAGDDPDPTLEAPVKARQARDELVDVLSGHSVLAGPEFAPWSLRYSGHQFGSWAGALGDGRAVSVRESLPTALHCIDLTLHRRRHAAPRRCQPHIRAAAQRRGPHAVRTHRRRPRRHALLHPRVPLL